MIRVKYYLICRINTTRKTANIIHKTIKKAITSFIRGDMLVASVPPVLGVMVFASLEGVRVTVGVSDEAGKLSVNTGSGARVVVGVCEGVSVGVNVAVGGPGVKEAVDVKLGVTRVIDGVTVCDIPVVGVVVEVGMLPVADAVACTATVAPVGRRVDKRR